MSSRNSVNASAQAGSLLLVVHDFVARSPDEISLAKGDRIELIERDDDFGDGWFLGRHMTNGSTGLFPEVYTTPAPKGTLNTGPNPRRASESLGSKAQSITPNNYAGFSQSPNTQHSPASMASPSATAVQRPASASTPQTSASPLAQNALRTSLPSPANSRSYSMMSADSPVMNETLSVIDEHITDMNTPRGSLVNGNKRDTMGSIYSTQPLNRRSYINGHETDEEEQNLHTEDEVMAWGPDRVAEYLEDHGVEKAHCEVFKEQEISGEVLLAMEQSSLFIKEFELGAVGRRLKTWHKVKALQEEVRRASPQVPRSNFDYSGMNEDASEGNRNRSASTGSALPRALSTRQSQEARSSTMQSAPSSGPANQDARSNTMQTMHSPVIADVASPLQTMTSASSFRPENTYRPSAQSVRSMNQSQSRRHSSIDSTSRSIDANVATSPGRQGHRKQPSLDQTWQPGQTTANGKPGHAHSESANFPKRDSSLVLQTSPSDLDKGYFSSNEVDRRDSSGKRNVLQKKAGGGNVSPIQSRAFSFMNGKNSAQAGRIASSDSLRDPVSPIASQAASNFYSKMNSLRASSSPSFGGKPAASLKDPISPVVTKLEYNNAPSMNAVANSSPNPNAADSESSSLNPTPSPASHTFSFFSSNKPKITGLRTISDAVTQNEKTMAAIPVDRVPSTVKEDVASPARTGSTTPSTDTRSFDLQKSELQSRTSASSGGNLMPPSTSTRRPKMRTKKTTSAYTRGLEKKTPAQQMEGCDYSGWMKKKSSNLMTTWKPRLFVLRGRRLSYYYADTDTEEKGLIDISFHRVLPAHEEKITGLHASLTGAASSPTSPQMSTTPTMASRDLKEHPPSSSDGLFIFKLVPPKVGLTKAVTFTKPMVHYFAVNSRQEGRLWMAALMKATIDRDEDGVVTTTYNQKTISLAKAKARRERPPALKEEDTEGRAELDAGGDDDQSGKGLGIGGLDTSAVAGAEQDDGNSFAPSTAASTVESSVLQEKEVLPATTGAETTQAPS